MNQYLPPDNTQSLPDEIILAWRKYLEEYDRLKKERDHSDMIIRLSADPNYEKYREAILINGRKDTDYGFEMLYGLHKHLEETPIEILQEEFDMVKDVDNDNLTVDEYFESLNPYDCGYSDGMKEIKNLLLLEINKDVNISDVEVIYTANNLIKLIGKL